MVERCSELRLHCWLLRHAAFAVAAKSIHSGAATAACFASIISCICISSPLHTSCCFFPRSYLRVCIVTRLLLLLLCGRRLQIATLEGPCYPRRICRQREKKSPEPAAVEGTWNTPTPRGAFRHSHARTTTGQNRWHFLLESFSSLHLRILSFDWISLLPYRATACRLPFAWTVDNHCSYLGLDVNTRGQSQHLHRLLRIRIV